MSSIRQFALLLCAFFAAAPAFAQQPPEFSIDVPAAIVSLPFRVVDAEFSTSLNAVVAASAAPNQLHVFRPDTGELASVNLQLAPSSVGVSPDGLFAAVGHDAFVSYVDLDDAVLLDTIAIAANVRDVVLAGEWIYAVVTNSGGTPVHSIHLPTGSQFESVSNFYGAMIRRHPGGLALYGASHSSYIARVDVDEGAAEAAGESHGYAACGNLWISADGARIYTACGNVFRASADPAQDMRYIGSFSQELDIQWAAHAQTAGTIAVLPELESSSASNGEIRYFTPDFLLYRGKAVLPRFSIGPNTFAAHGRWVFFNAAGTKQYVVVQAETASGLANDYGLVTVDCTAATVSLNPTSASFSTSFATAQIAVTGTAGCGWSSSSNVPWITTNSYGVGDGTVTYTVSANGGAASRTGMITVGNASFTVNQAGSPPSSLVATATSPTSVSLTWTSAVAADHFEIWRSTGGTFTLAGTTPSTNFTDATTANAGHVYKVRAVETGGALSAFSAPDSAHTFTFTDPVLTAGMTIRAAHVTELRDAINAIRIAAGMSAATFTDAALQSIVAKRVHITELRDALNAARVTIGSSPTVFSTLPVNDVIRASTTDELREASR